MALMSVFTMQPPALQLMIVLYQPDIPQNTGTILRMCACLGLSAAIIEPAGFFSTDRSFRRAGMDYLSLVDLKRYPHWRAFEEWRRVCRRRLVLMTAKGGAIYTAHKYWPSDILLFGRESAGVPKEVHEAADVCLTIPMKPPARSLNVAVAAAMAAGEAVRQLAAAGKPS